MSTCWKCHSALRTPNAAFCHLCGAAQQGQNSTAPDWRARIEEGERQHNWGLSFLWLLAFLLAPLTFPILLCRATRRLREHVKQRLGAPAFASPRFAQSPEGQAITYRLVRSTGNLNGGATFPAVLSYLMIFAMAIAGFIFPAIGPDQIRYEDAIEAVFSVEPARRYVYCTSSEQYEDLWNTLPIYRYDRVRVSAYSEGGSGGNMQRWPAGRIDTRENHRPYRYIEQWDNGRGSWANRVNSLILEWDAPMIAGVVFYVMLGLLFLLYLIGGLVFWTRFARHAQAEALAAAYARGDTGFHDRIMGTVRGRSSALLFFIVILAITPLHIVLFPILSAFMFSRHYGFERGSGIANALGIAGPAAPGGFPVVSK